MWIHYYYYSALLLLFITIITVALAQDDASSEVCDAQWCYFSASSCRTGHDVHPSSIHSAEENNMIATVVRKTSHNIINNIIHHIIPGMSTSVLGLGGYAFSGAMGWEDGTSSDYTPAGFVLPSSSGFLAMDTTGQWSVVSFYKRPYYMFVCKKPYVAPTASTTTTTTTETTSTSTEKPTTTTTTTTPTTTTTTTTSEEEVTNTTTSTPTDTTTEVIDNTTTSNIIIDDTNTTVTEYSNTTEEETNTSTEANTTTIVEETNYTNTTEEGVPMTSMANNNNNRTHTMSMPLLTTIIPDNTTATTVPPGNNNNTNYTSRTSARLAALASWVAGNLSSWSETLLTYTVVPPYTVPMALSDDDDNNKNNENGDGGDDDDGNDDNNDNNKNNNIGLGSSSAELASRLFLYFAPIPSNTTSSICDTLLPTTLQPLLLSPLLPTPKGVAFIVPYSALGDATAAGVYGVCVVYEDKVPSSSNNNDDVAATTTTSSPTSSKTKLVVVPTTASLTVTAIDALFATATAQPEQWNTQFIALPLPPTSAADSVLSVAIRGDYQFHLGACNSNTAESSTIVSPIIVGPKLYIMTTTNAVSSLCAVRRATEQSWTISVASTPVVSAISLQYTFAAGTDAVFTVIGAPTTEGAVSGWVETRVDHCSSSTSTGTPLAIVRTGTPEMQYIMPIPTSIKIKASNTSTKTTTGGIICVRVGAQRFPVMCNNTVVTVGAPLPPQEALSVVYGAMVRARLKTYVMPPTDSLEYLHAVNSLSLDGTHVFAVPLSSSTPTAAPGNNNNDNNVDDAAATRLCKTGKKMAGFTVVAGGITFTQDTWSQLSLGSYCLCYQLDSSSPISWLRVYLNIIDSDAVLPTEATIIARDGDYIGIHTVVPVSSTAAWSVGFAPPSSSCSGVATRQFYQVGNTLVGKVINPPGSYSVCIGLNAAQEPQNTGVHIHFSERNSLSTVLLALRSVQWNATDVGNACDAASGERSAAAAVVDPGIYRTDITVSLDAGATFEADVTVGTTLVEGATLLSPCKGCPLLALLPSVVCVASSALWSNGPLTLPHWGDVVMVSPQRSGALYRLVPSEFQDCSAPTTGKNSSVLMTDPYPVTAAYSTENGPTVSFYDRRHRDGNYIVCMRVGGSSDVPQWLPVSTATMRGGANVVRVTAVESAPTELLLTQDAATITVRGTFDKGVTAVSLVLVVGPSCDATVVMRVPLEEEEEMSATSDGAANGKVPQAHKKTSLAKARLTVDPAVVSGGATVTLCYSVAQGPIRAIPRGTTQLTVHGPVLDTLDWLPTIPVATSRSQPMSFYMTDPIADVPVTSVLLVAATELSMSSADCDRNGVNVLGIVDISNSNARSPTPAATTVATLLQEQPSSSPPQQRRRYSTTAVDDNTPVFILPPISAGEGYIRLCVSVAKNPTNYIPAHFYFEATSAGGVVEDSYVLRLWFNTAVNIMRDVATIYVTNVIVNNTNAIVGPVGTAGYVVLLSPSINNKPTKDKNNKKPHLSEAQAAIVELYTRLVTTGLRYSINQPYDATLDQVAVYYINGTVVPQYPLAVVQNLTLTTTASPSATIDTPNGGTAYKIFLIITIPLTVGVIWFAFRGPSVKEMEEQQGQPPQGRPEDGMITIDSSPLPRDTQTEMTAVSQSRDRNAASSASPTRTTIYSKYNDNNNSNRENEGAASPNPQHPLKDQLGLGSPYGKGKHAAVLPPSTLPASSQPRRASSMLPPPPPPPTTTRARLDDHDPLDTTGLGT